MCSARWPDRCNIGGRNWVRNEHLSLLAAEDMREEWRSPTQGRVGVMTPAGSDRFRGWGGGGIGRIGWIP